jgi:Family of unknown function (DUF6922)
MGVPDEQAWLFWDLDAHALDSERDAYTILTRVLEQGRLRDVAWLLAHYGRERVHRYFREGASPELSQRTLSFWRAFFEAEEEAWPRPPDFRRSSAAPWPG